MTPGLREHVYHFCRDLYCPLFPQKTKQVGGFIRKLKSGIDDNRSGINWESQTGIDSKRFTLVTYES